MRKPVEADRSDLPLMKEVIDLIKFIKASPTAYHAGSTALHRCVVENGFTELKENHPWKIIPGGKYFISRDISSFIAFVMPNLKPVRVCILGAHTDSPGLKLKPMPEKTVDNAVLLCPEVYGSPITPSWMGRKLGIAGQITYLDNQGLCKNSLINFERTIGRIPYVAIHLERTQKDKIEINFQEHLPVLFGLEMAEAFNFEQELKKIIPFSKLLSHDLFLVGS